MLTTASDVSDIPIVDISPDQSKSEAKQWLSTYRHQRARTQAVFAELRSGPACEALRGKEFSAASAAVSAGALQRLQSELWSQVDGARNAVRRITHMLATARPGAAAPVHDLATAIDVADQALAAARDQQCAALESLYQEEAQLEAEIEAIGSRLDAELMEDASAWAAPGPAGCTGKASAPARPASAGQRRPNTSRPRQRRASSGGGGPGGGGAGSLAPEVQEYEEFMAQYGPTGGWDPEDHEEFLAILRSCGGDYTHAVAIVLERAIGYSRQDVMDHARWHMEMTDLELRKRLALERWRQARQQQRAALVAQQAALHSDTAELAQRERQRDQRSREEEVMLVDAKRALAARWRAEKEATQRAAAAEARQRAEVQAAARRAELEQRQAVNKLRLQMCKEAKERQRREEQRRAAAETAIKAALSAPTPQQLQRVAERSNSTFQRRQSLLATHEAMRSRRERVQQQLLDKVQVEAPTDPSRLLKGTAAHMQRVEAQRAEERKARDSGFILHVSSRVTPTWRAGLAGG